MTRAELEGYVGKPAELDYRDIHRVGRIVDIRRGPCFPKGNGTFGFADKPWGSLYIMWVERGQDFAKSFAWDKVKNFKLTQPESSRDFEAAVRAIVEPQSETEIKLVVRRMRPTIGGL